MAVRLILGVTQSLAPSPYDLVIECCWWDLKRKNIHLALTHVFATNCSTCIYDIAGINNQKSCILKREVMHVYCKCSNILNTFCLPNVYMYRQSAQTQIRLFLKKQSDLSCPCLLFSERHVVNSSHDNPHFI